jgi:hypothetical protein
MSSAPGLPMCPRFPRVTRSFLLPWVAVMMLSSIGKIESSMPLMTSSLQVGVASTPVSAEAEPVGLGGVPGDRCRWVCVAVPELVGKRVGQGEGVFHLVLSADPFGVEHVMAAAALHHDGEQSVGVGVRDAECMAAVDVCLGARCVIGPVGVKPADEKQDRPPACRFRAGGQAEVCGYGGVEIACRCVGVRERDVDRGARGLSSRRPCS